MVAAGRASGMRARGEGDSVETGLGNCASVGVSSAGIPGAILALGLAGLVSRKTNGLWS